MQTDDTDGKWLDERQHTCHGEHKKRQCSEQRYGTATQGAELWFLLIRHHPE
jgi:hypothetical protein